MLTINDRLAIPLREFSFSFARSSGPGGQNVNKVNTKVTLKWPLAASCLPEDVKRRIRSLHGRRINRDDELVMVSQRFRDQGRNVADCLARLRELVAAAAVPPTPRIPTRPTRASRRRRLQDKRQQSERKQRRRGSSWEQ